MTSLAWVSVATRPDWVGLDHAWFWLSVCVLFLVIVVGTLSRRAARKLGR